MTTASDDMIVGLLLIILSRLTDGWQSNVYYILGLAFMALAVLGKSLFRGGDA